MKIKTTRIDKNVPMPEYTDRAAGFDFICRQDDTIAPGEVKALPGNISMDIPDGYVLILAPRSSTHELYGLVMPHSIGIIDPFSHSRMSEISVMVQNVSDKPVTLKKGDKIAQGVLVKYEKVEFEEVDR